MVIATQPRTKQHWSPTGRTEVTQDYYRVRECSEDQPDFDWRSSVDPDGRLRDRLTKSERQKWLEDNEDLIWSINRRPPQSVLDFGAGPGWLLNVIEAPLKVAVETSPICLELLLANPIIDMASESLADYASDSQDLVIAYHVFEHLVDPLYHLRHIRRVLRPGGMLILGTPDFGCPCAKRFGSNFRMLHDPTHRSLFTLESCSRMLRDNAFEIYDVQFPFPERYATAENFLRWKDTNQVSPPWPGNWMTFFARR